MNNTGSDKENVKILTDLLLKKGVKHVVLSPGSRNAPLIISFTRQKQLKHYVVVDERSAAFFALGIAQQAGEPVALACTSGTAVLNYSPAVAEAYYQQLPLIVISADRPEEWIDQDDCQTIRQRGILSNIVKGSYQLPSEIYDESTRWFTNRMVNDAINCAVNGKRGPVHINVPLGEPLYGKKDYQETGERSIDFVESAEHLCKLPTSLIEQFNSCRKVMILAGFQNPSGKLQAALDVLSGLPQVVILSEATSNLHADSCIVTIDRVLATIPLNERAGFAPDLLITLGGSLVSKHVKAFLREHSPVWHWSVGKGEHPVDTFKSLTSQINVNAEDIFEELAGCVNKNASHYADIWKKRKESAHLKHNEFIEHVQWSDLKAFSLILPALPTESVLQVANSTPVRYVQLFDNYNVARVNSNRGTSGIDGSTSTAIGALQIHNRKTVLITGDMSFLYDSNALWNKYITPNLKIIVMKNGGGGIFRFLQGPSDLEELEECFETEQNVNVEGFAGLHGFAYFTAKDETCLKRVLGDFINDLEKPAILEVETPRLINDRVLKDYFKYLGN